MTDCSFLYAVFKYQVWSVSCCKYIVSYPFDMTSCTISVVKSISWISLMLFSILRSILATHEHSHFVPNSFSYTIAPFLYHNNTWQLITTHDISSYYRISEHVHGTCTQCCKECYSAHRRQDSPLSVITALHWYVRMYIHTPTTCTLQLSTSSCIA